MRLRILNIKPWCIKFTFNGQRYFLKEASYGFEYAVKLYRFDLTDDKGHYNTECLGSRFGSLSISDYISNPYKRGRTYKEIDPLQFMSQLAVDGFGEVFDMTKDDIERFVIERKLIRCNNKIAELKKSLKKECSKAVELTTSRLAVLREIDSKYGSCYEERTFYGS